MMKKNKTRKMIECDQDEVEKILTGQLLLISEYISEKSIDKDDSSKVSESLLSKSKSFRSDQ